MSLDKVVEDILRRGEEKMKEILRQGEQERDEQLVQAKKYVEESRKKGERQVQATVAQMEQQEVSSGELEAKRVLLAAQRRVMEDLKEQVLAELTRYPPDRRKAMYAKLVSSASKELGGCYVYSNVRDKGLLSLPSGMEDGGTLDCSGGLVFESKDRSVRLDFRFESILEDVWSKRMQDIYGKLFG